MSGRFTWVESPVEPDASIEPAAPFEMVAREPMHGLLHSTPTHSARQVPLLLPLTPHSIDRAPTPHWETQRWERSVVVVDVPTYAGSTSSTSRRDGIIGITVGLVLLAATLAGSVAMSSMGNRPSGTPSPAVMAPQASVTPVVPVVSADPAPLAVPSADPEAAPALAPATAPVTAPSPRPRTAAAGAARSGVTARRVPPAQPAASAHSPAARKPSRPAAHSARRPATSGGGRTAAAAVPTPAVTAPVAAPVPAPAPAATQPVSWSVSTPNGASWTAPASDYDLTVSSVANATMTPNF